MGASDDDGYVAMNAPAFEAERQVLAARPERRAAEVINTMTVDTAAFGTVPGGTAAAGRMTAWVDRSRTEMGRVTAEVTDLEASTAKARDLCLQGAADTAAAARTATPR
jgi:hypothetical protein